MTPFDDLQYRHDLILKRNKIIVRSHFTVEYAGDLKVRSTCRTCRKISIKDYSFEVTGKHFDEADMRKLTLFQDSGNTLLGVCSVCTKAERDRLYPLPPPKFEAGGT
jgi:hypothetical protein